MSLVGVVGVVGLVAGGDDLLELGLGLLDKVRVGVLEVVGLVFGGEVLLGPGLGLLILATLALRVLVVG